MILSLELRRRYEQDIDERAAQQRFIDEIYVEPIFPQRSILRPALRMVGRGMVASGRLLMRLGGDAPANSRTMTMHNA